MTKRALYRLRFRRQHDIYNAGDPAAFPEHIHNALTEGTDPPAVSLESPANTSATPGGRADAKRSALAVKTNKELGELLASAGKSTKGKKATLIARLLGEEE